MVKVLQGMRVVEGSAFVAVPLAGMTLAPTSSGSIASVAASTTIAGR